ncbi:hypothetical protein LCGC14_2490150 [marine sediment metagenome]|uniref:HTH cro/C1-type domain-containing protein n=1 Tax=marine sediment metagenome TaxID=412755 RepID=A0A0F9DGT4_9ZZZZ
MNSAAFLDALRVKHNLPSDNQLAKFLEMPRERISMYRTGKREFDASTCIVIAFWLEEPPGYVLASIEAARAKRTKIREVWTLIAQQAKKASAAALVCVITALLSASPAGVSQAKGVSDAAALTIYTLYAVGAGARVRVSRETL